MIPLDKRMIVHRSASICMALLGMGPFAAIVHAEDYAKSFSVSNRAHVRVVTNDGSVNVTTGDTKEVELHVEYRGYELAKTLHIDSRQVGDEVELTARVLNKFRFSLGQTTKLHIEVRMPKDGDLHVETGDGSIKANGLSGTVDLHSGDGSVTVNALNGVVRLHTGDGTIDGSNLDGNCEAFSGDGSIGLSGRFDVLRAKSGDGSINVHALQGSKLDSEWNIGSGDGSIDVTLPSGLPLDIDASTSDGRIRSEIPITVEGLVSNSRVRGKMNGGGQTLTIHSGDGSIHLKQA
jgi:Putative adhesin